MNALNKLSNLEDVRVDFKSTVKGKNAHALFCENWDNAKLALEAIAAIIKNPVVKLIVNIITSVGDGIRNKVC